MGTILQDEYYCDISLHFKRLGLGREVAPDHTKHQHIRHRYACMAAILMTNWGGLQFKKLSQLRTNVHTAHAEYVRGWRAWEAAAPTHVSMGAHEFTYWSMSVEVKKKAVMRTPY